MGMSGWEVWWWEVTCPLAEVRKGEEERCGERWPVPWQKWGPWSWASKHHSQRGPGWRGSILQATGLLQSSLDFTLHSQNLGREQWRSPGLTLGHNLNYLYPKVWKTVESHQGLSEKFATGGPSGNQTCYWGCAPWKSLITLTGPTMGKNSN